MYPTVLFPTDFSEYSRACQNCLPQFRAAGTKRAVLLYVIQPIDFVHWAGTDLLRLDDVRKAATERLCADAYNLRQTGLGVDYRVEVGVPHETIVDVAEAEDVSLIFLGSHGEGFVRTKVLGTVAERVIRHARRPVLALKAKLVSQMGRHVCEFVCKHLFRRVLFPTDFSRCADQAFQHLRTLRDTGLEEVVLLHVQDTRKLLPHLQDRLEEFNRTDRARLEKIASELEFLGVKAKTNLAEGVPFLEINRVAQAEDADLIVMGSHGRSEVGEMLVGSVTQEVVRKQVRPVLVIRREE